MTQVPNKFIRAIACSGIAIGLTTAPVLAQEVGEIPFFYADPGSAALGGGIRGGGSLYFDNQNEEIRDLDLIPLYLYEGRYLYFRGTSAGVHLFKNDSFQANIHARYRFDQLKPASNDFYAGLEKREQSIDAGVQLTLSQNWGQVRLTGVHDTLNRHNGTEVELSYRYIFDIGRWYVSPFVSYAWQDDNLTNYYFGVSESEALPDRPEYSADSSQWLGFGLNAGWNVTDRIVLFGNVGFNSPSDDVLDSPLVNQDGSADFFVGGTYVFGNVRDPSFITDEERKGEWAWRVNYGYQADGNIISEIDQGDLSKSELADTNIAGFTLSRLLTDGKRADFVGKIAAFRHFEEDEGNGNFWSFAAFIMARGIGYSPWSKEEIFRYGFGFGMSYAQEVPIAEQRKQANSGGNTSKFLNYLELTVDFPLRRVSRAKWIQGCYAGVTVVHRSGIFGTSDLLGDVAGGADWITAHLECTH